MPTQILVLLHTYPDGSSANIAAHVSTVARHLGADVHGLVLNATFPPVSSLLGNILINVDSMVHEVTASAAETYARYCDLIVTGLSTNDVSMEATAETVVFGSGRPTLLVPQDAAPSPYQHAMIAWDGSRVATRAVADARDFLRLAKTVTIAVVTDEKSLPEENPGLKLADYLDRRGITAPVALVQAWQRPIARVLQDHALEIGADFMVIGAFGHSRMRDFVMGGATAGILRDLKLPVLLSH